MKLDFRRHLRTYRGRAYAAELVISSDTDGAGGVSFIVSELSVIYVKCDSLSLKQAIYAVAACYLCNTLAGVYVYMSRMFSSLQF